MSNSEEEDVGSSRRVEIDTSAPFESVKEAVSRFGGIGYWKPSSYPHTLLLLQGGVAEKTDLALVEEQARMLENDLFAKERETLDVLKELEATKSLVGDLKLKLQKHSLEAVSLDLDSGADDRSVSPPALEGGEKEEDAMVNGHGPSEGLSLFPSSAPGLILMELKQAKLNLSKTTTDLDGIRASVDSLNKKLDRESVSLNKARERLTHNCSKIASLEKELSQAKLKLGQVKEAGANGGSDNALHVTRELQRLSCEAELFKKMGEAAKSEVLKTVSEIEQTKARIKTAEIRLFAARKMKEAARAAESMALADIKALSSSSIDSLQEGVTLTCEEYLALISNAREAEERSRAKVMEAMVLVDEENVTKTEILKRVGETAGEVKISKKVLEDALNRVEAANRGKLAGEEALRKWRSENGQRRRSVQNSAKFKNAYPTQHRRDSYVHDVNGLELVNDGPTPLLKQTLSIGQILSRKLLVPEEVEAGGQAGKGGCLKRKVSLGQMLSKRNGNAPPSGRKADKENCNKQLQFSGKRKKFGFARISHLLSKQNKKKKRPTPDLR